MKKSICLFLMIAATTICFSGLANADYSFIDFNVPNAQQTIVFGIEGQHIVGVYLAKGSSYGRGFLFDGTSFTTIDVPGAFETAAAVSVEEKLSDGIETVAIKVSHIKQVTIPFSTSLGLHTLLTPRI